MKKVCFVNSTHKWGGVKTWSLEVGSELMAAGIECHVLARKGPFLDMALDMGFRGLPVRFGIDYNPILIVRMFRYFRVQGIDLVVVNVGKDVRTAGLAARMAGIPVIHRVGLAGDMQDKLDVRLNHALVKPGLLVPCRQIRDGLLRELPFLGPDEIVVAHTVKPPGTDRPNAVNSPPVIVSTSQLNSDKGHAVVLEALAGLKGQGFSIRYEIVGTGREQNFLEALAAKLGLGDSVVWHGFRTDVRSILKRADLFVLASTSEGFPNSLLEAMAEGLVCVSRDVGGVDEIWPASNVPLLAQNANAQEFGAAIASILALPASDLLARKQKQYDEYAAWVGAERAKRAWPEVFAQVASISSGRSCQSRQQ
ncbi:MAG: glycosyltransferase [Deltaproteobacteria bacterium]|nr:glycosyltransferase [Deltaproteobacteria bacterium]